MHSIRLFLLGLATTFSLAPVPVLAGYPMTAAGPDAVMITPLSARGRFVFVTRVSRRVLREAVAQQRQSIKVMIPLPREIL